MISRNELEIGLSISHFLISLNRNKPRPMLKRLAIDPRGTLIVALVEELIFRLRPITHILDKKIEASYQLIRINHHTTLKI